MKRLNLKKDLEAMKQFMGEQLSPARKYVRTVFNLDVLGWVIALVIIFSSGYALYQELCKVDFIIDFGLLLLGALVILERVIPAFVNWFISPYGVLTTGLTGIGLLILFAVWVFRIVRSSRAEAVEPATAAELELAVQRNKQEQKEKKRKVFFRKEAKARGYRDIFVTVPEGTKNIATRAEVSFFRGGKLEGRVRSLYLYLKVSKHTFGHRKIRLLTSQIVSVSKATLGLSRNKVRVTLADGSIIKGKLPRKFLWWGDELVFATAQNSDEVISRKAWFAIRS